MDNWDKDPPTGENSLEKLALGSLVHHGQKDGYVTNQDIIDLFPDAEFDDQAFQDVVEKVHDAGVDYQESGDGDQSPVEDFNEQAEALEEVALRDLAPEEDYLADIEADNMIRMYAREATRTPLLTAEEEVTLSKAIEACRLAQQELSRGNTSPKRAEELQQIIQRGQRARDRLIQANMRLVISIARRYVGQGLPFLDLIQEGNIGLMRAVRHYDYHKGFRFSTYATWWIRQAVTRVLADQSRSIRLPVYLSDQVNRMRREQVRLLQELGRTPTAEELAKVLGITPQKVEQLIEVSRQPLSLETPVGEDEEDELGDVIGDATALSPEESAIQSTSRAELHRLVDALPPRERQILELRYGLSGEAPLTLQAVGERMGITRERARQLEVQALNRLRAPGGKRQKLR